MRAKTARRLDYLVIAVIAIVMGMLFLAPIAASAQTREQRVDQVLIIGGISMSSVALGLTMSCTSAGTCRELNPAMARVIGESPLKATVFKSAANGVAYYTLWRVTKGKTRTILLATLTALNTYDAIHDIRQMRQDAR